MIFPMRRLAGTGRSSGASGARLAPARAELGIGLNTYRRWKAGGGYGWPEPVRPRPSNALTEAEQAEVLAVCYRPEWASLAPAQIVPRLLDEAESAADSRTVIERAVLREGVVHRPQVLHADNASAMKGATLYARLSELGVTLKWSTSGNWAGHRRRS